MIDLFDGLNPTTTKEAEKFATSSGNLAATSRELLGTYSKTDRSSHATFPANKAGEHRTRSALLSDLLQVQRSANRTSDLRDRRASLESEIEEAEAQYSPARAAEEPYRLAFKAAHSDLEALHNTRRAGLWKVTKTEMLASYDRRLHAGHAWHPFRTEADALQRWLKLLRDELKAVNKEIGI